MASHISEEGMEGGIMKKNTNVPIAILSCFLIAFIIQGILKLCGVFIFEKALHWGIFKIIDNNVWLQVIYYSIIVFVTMYCLSFILTDRPYSQKLWQYLVLIIFAFSVTTFRILGTYSAMLNIFLDIVIYILVPFFITITTNVKYRMFENSLFGVVTTLSINIFMYFGYLGLNFWSNILNSLLPINTIWLPASTNLLIQLEVYIGLITLMLSMNGLVRYVKRRLS